MGKTKRDNFDSESALDSDSEDELQFRKAGGDDEEWIVGVESHADMRMLWFLWLVSIFLGAIFVLQWFRPFSDITSGGPWRPGYQESSAGPGRARVVATFIFGMYGIGSAVTALIYACTPDVLAANAYGLAQIRNDTQANVIAEEGTVFFGGIPLHPTSIPSVDDAERPTFTTGIGEDEYLGEKAPE